MAQAKKGDKVKIDFTGKLEDGTVFDTTIEEEGASEGCSTDDCSSDDCSTDGCGCDETGPMELTIGEEEFFIEIEKALVGMAVGEKKSVVIPCDDAFGDYDEAKVFTVGRDQFPEDLKPEVGHDLELTDEDDESMMVTVVEVTDADVTFDANHPLAGEDLTFDFELLEIL